MRRSGLPEDCGTASGVATRTVSPGKARARLLSVASKASSGSGTRLMRRLAAAPVAGAEVRSILVCVEAIGRSGLSQFWVVAQSVRAESLLSRRLLFALDSWCRFQCSCLFDTHTMTAVCILWNLELPLERCLLRCMWLLAGEMQSRKAKISGRT